MRWFAREQSGTCSLWRRRDAHPSSGVLAAARPAVVELFTSQGCNSCPPADALLGELAERSDVLALSFHVDYWDKFGWRDRFALPAAKQRQFAYVRHFGQDWVYTPEMVIDGHVDVLGADRKALQQQLAPPRSGVPVHIAVQGKQLNVSIEAAPGSPASDVLLIGYQPSAVTAIAVGENAGRDLHEFNIVRSIATLGRWTGAAAQWHVDLKHTACGGGQGRGAAAAPRAGSDHRCGQCGVCHAEREASTQSSTAARRCRFRGPRIPPPGASRDRSASNRRDGRTAG